MVNLTSQANDSIYVGNSVSRLDQVLIGTTTTLLHSQRLEKCGYELSPVRDSN